MARYVLIKDNLFQEHFINIAEAQNFAMDNFEAKLINVALHDKFGNKKLIKEILEDNNFKLLSLKEICNSQEILDDGIANVHIEDGILVLTFKDGTSFKIKHEKRG